ncbi:MAG: hypothetical protein K2X49_05655 [Acetobacteraceae bacterium]|nr:hypothetical protein [Acetobacteraceae bacterium]
MSRVILHVGMHKTGSSSIQASLHAARDALAARRIIYAPLGKNHSVPIFNAFNDGDAYHRWHRRRGIAEDGTADDVVRGARMLLREHFRSNPGKDFVISGEGIPGLSEQSTKRLLRFLDLHFARVEVVFFVRPPASFIHSQAQQQIKAGWTLERLTAARFRIPYRQFEKYFDLLPPDAISARVFSRSTLVEGCVVKTFCSLAALPEVPVRRANEGLSRLSADLLLVANEVLPATLPDGRRNPERSPRLSQLRLPGPKFYAPRETVLRGLESSRDQIEWISAVLGANIEEYDDGLTVQDYHPGTIDPDAMSELKDRVLHENGRLLRDAADNPGRRGGGGQRRRGAATAAATATAPDPPR